MLLRKTNSIFKVINSTLLDLPRPSNISYSWNFGRLLGICLIAQIIRGLFLRFYYTSEITEAFNSVNQITRNVNIGWLIRLTHANGASLFFILIYLHIGRGLYYISFYNYYTWIRGIIILLVLMGTAFLGYVLPWGQISFWGATVITNLLSAIPYLGEDLTVWIWGGYSIEKPTLIRFFSLHFLMPFLLLLLIIIHIILLHEKGSSNPIGASFNIDKVSFHPFFSSKDILGLLVFISILLYIILLKPYIFTDPENFIPANPLMTPIHIQPEWYFLFAYAILRSIPNKLGGVVALFMSILMLLRCCFSFKSNYFTPIYPLNKFMFYRFSVIFIFLTFLGACSVEPPFIGLSQIFTILYFSFFMLAPLTCKI